MPLTHLIGRQHPLRLGAEPERALCCRGWRQHVLAAVECSV